MSLAHIVGAARRPFVASIPNVTWNPADAHASMGFSEGDYRYRKASGAGWVSCRATLGRSSGKYYYEVGFNRYAFGCGGFGNVSAALFSYTGANDKSVGLVSDNGRFHNGVSTAGFLTGSFEFMDTLCVALDFTNGKYWFRRNGNAWNSGIAGTQDPATNQGGVAIPATITGLIYPMASVQNFSTDYGNSDVGHGRFQIGDFLYVIPSGFSAWDSNVSPLIASDKWRYNFSTRFNAGIWVKELYMRTLADPSSGNPYAQQHAISGVNGIATSSPVEQAGYTVDLAFNRANIGNGYAPTATLPAIATFTFNKPIVIRQGEIWSNYAPTQAPSQIDVQYHNGSSWVTLFSKTFVFADYDMNDRTRFTIQ